MKKYESNKINNLFDIITPTIIYNITIKFIDYTYKNTRRYCNFIHIRYNIIYYYYI
jgi:RNAse (barnase) inhibitor barstar